MSLRSFTTSSSGKKSPGDSDNRRVPENGIAPIFAGPEACEEAIHRAVRDAVLRHKRLGESIAVWRDGRVVIIPPEEIPEDL
jgi:hypothetical protein